MERTKFGLAAIVLYILGIVSIPLAIIFLGDVVLGVTSGITMLVTGFFAHALHDATMKHQTAQETITRLLKVIAIKDAGSADDREALLALGNPDKERALAKAAERKRQAAAKAGTTTQK